MNNLIIETETSIDEITQILNEAGIVCYIYTNE